MVQLKAAAIEARKAQNAAAFGSRDAVSACAMQRIAMAGALLLLVGGNAPTYAEKRYGPGVTDTEIKLGQTMPYSGPASPFATIGRAEQAYFDKINDEGGVNGRKIKLISMDDAFNPAKTVEQTRKLVEGEGVLALFNSLGPGQQAVRKYVNLNKVPFLFVGAGAREWDDPKQFPWSIGFQPSFESEGRAFGHYIAQHYPQGRVAVLGDDRELGRDGLHGLRDVLSGGSAQIVATATHEIDAPTVDSQIVTLQASGADVFVDWSSPKTAAQIIRKLHAIGWHPVHLLSVVSSSVEAVLVPAGLDKSVGIVTTGFFK
jgi:ABC-type branched-subunit amino acid transport system substrate-binding protein